MAGALGIDLKELKDTGTNLGVEPKPRPMPANDGNGAGTVTDGGPGEFIGPAAAEPMLVRPRPLARGGTPAGVAIESGTTRIDPPPPPQGLMR